MKIPDQILYCQLLTAAGFTVHEATQLRVFRGSGVDVCGTFTQNGVPCTSVRVKLGNNSHVVIGTQEYRVCVHNDGTFDLLVAHSDGPQLQGER